MKNLKSLKIIQEFYKQNNKTTNMIGHFSNNVSIISFQNRSLEMAGYLKKGDKVLDWGSGFGQITIILDELGFDVTPFDVAVPEKNLFKPNKAVVLAKDPVSLPFPDNHFDAVLSMGVLEHVPDIDGSLKEIRRVLKPGGYFFVFNFPYKYSPSEYYASLFKISVHPIKFTRKDMKNHLNNANFKLIKISYENAIPKVCGPIKFIRNFYNLCPNFFLIIDSVICNIPLIRNLFCNSIKAVAKKEDAL